MTAIAVRVAVHDVVSLVHRWGSQRRLRCPQCKVYIPDTYETECIVCKTIYRHVKGDDYMVMQVALL
jgi:hypothetical protein